MSINRVSEKVSQPPVSSFEPSHDRDIKTQDNILSLSKDAKSAESVNNVKPSIEDVRGEVEKLNQIVKNYNHKLNFDVDQKTKQVVVKVIDGDTKKVIRQIPPEEIINLSQRMDELKGMIFNDGG
ncbi:MAG: flagellar protein FlaG [Nitrospinae bacterium]|nr:flagellar protein FlaG [Nitrospinota bacterium]